MKYLTGLILILCAGVCLAAPFKKVIYVVFENKQYVDVMENEIMAKYASKGLSFNKMYAQGHPSQPNYIAMVAGSTLGVSGNGAYDLSDNHLGDLLEAKGLNWHMYAEGFPGNCHLGDNGKYKRKHNPFISFTNVSQNQERCKNITGLDSFNADWDSGRLANFNMIAPNSKNSGHDESIDFLANWFDRTFGARINNQALMKDVLFIITFDEDDGRGDNQIYTVMISQDIRPGSTNNDRHSHYSLLKMIEDNFQLGNLGRFDKTAPVIR